MPLRGGTVAMVLANKFHRFLDRHRSNIHRGNQTEPISIGIAKPWPIIVRLANQKTPQPVNHRPTDFPLLILYRSTFFLWRNR